MVCPASRDLLVSSYLLDLVPELEHSPANAAAGIYSQIPVDPRVARLLVPWQLRLQQRSFADLALHSIHSNSFVSPGHVSARREDGWLCKAVSPKPNGKAGRWLCNLVHP